MTQNSKLRPYFRPRRNLPKAPWLPSGFILVRDALDRLGRARHGSNWTGDEIYARKINFGPSIPPIRPGWSDSAHTILPWEPWRSLPYSEAVVEWEREKDSLENERQDEPKKRERFEDIFGELRNALCRGWLSNAVYTDSGRKHKGPTDFWGSPAAEQVLKNGRTKIVSEYGQTLTGWVVVTEVHIQQLIDGKDVPANQTELDPDSGEQETSNPLKRGPKRKLKRLIWCPIHERAVRLHQELCPNYPVDEVYKRLLAEIKDVDSELSKSLVDVEGEPITEFAISRGLSRHFGRDWWDAPVTPA